MIDMQKLFFIVLVFSSIVGHSQAPSASSNNFYLNADLSVIADKYPTFASGTPYFIEEWSNADVELENGGVTQSVKVRLDLIDNTLQYISPEGRELVATTAPIKSVIFKDSPTGNKIKFIRSSFLGTTKNAKPGWYMELVSGRASFYKLISKTIVQPANYSAGQTQSSVNTSEEYFIYTDSTLLPVKKIKEVPGLLNNKFKQVDTYVTNNKLSGKSEQGFIELIKYYNTLF